jgi:hypothetical protein
VLQPARLDPQLSPRLAGLPRANALGLDVPIADGPLSRLLGLALIPLERAGVGLLLTNCRGIHTFGMRFPVDVVFLGASGEELRRVRNIRAGRFVACRTARAVLELPARTRGGSAARIWSDGLERR